MVDHRKPLPTSGSLAGTEPRHGDNADGGRRGEIPALPPLNTRLERPVLPRANTDSTTMVASSTSTQHVDNWMQRLDMEQFKASLLHDIVAKLKTEFVADNLRQGKYAESVFEDDHTLTPSSTQSISPKSLPKKPYQATVEDEDPQEPTKSSSREATVCKPTWPEESNAQESSTNSARSSNSSVSSSVTSNTSLRRRSYHSTSSDAHTPPMSASPKAKLETKPRPTVHFESRPVILHNQSDYGSCSRVPVRPAMPDRVSTDSGLSAVDLKWGKLFDVNGEPTKRLGQVLRGLAQYLTVNFDPINSLVITPEKLSVFYARYAQESDFDILRLRRLFNSRSRDAFKSLQYLYQDLDCEYHLVQDQTKSKAYIPALTPGGFERWMTLMIRSYPDAEAMRLASVMKELPIEAEGSSVEGKVERLPKQLSRTLLPAKRHEKSYDTVVKSLAEWAKSMGLSQPSSPRSSLTHQAIPSTSREDTVRRYVVEEPRDGKAPRSRKMRDYHKEPHDSGHAQYERATKEISSTHTDRHRRARSPTITNRHRASAPVVSSHSSSLRLGSSGHVANSSSPTTSHPVANVASQDAHRRSREEEYRFLQGRDPHFTLESKPRVGVDEDSRKYAYWVRSSISHGHGSAPSYEEFRRDGLRTRA